VSQIPLFGEFGADPYPKEKAPKPKQQPKSAAKRITSAVVQKIEVQSKPHPTPAQWGNCRVCGAPIAIPGLDASLCSNPARICGSGVWVVDPQWLAANPSRTGKGGAA
jgi:hypothetical protein